MLHPKFQIQGHHDIIKINHSLILALVFSAVTKLFKIHICRMQISASKIRQMRMRMSLDKRFLSRGMQHTGLCQLNECDNMLFPDVSIISIQISTM